MCNEKTVIKSYQLSLMTAFKKMVLMHKRDLVTIVYNVFVVFLLRLISSNVVKITHLEYRTYSQKVD